MKKIILILVFISILSSCNLPQANEEPSASLVQTAVIQTLNSFPTRTETIKSELESTFTIQPTLTNHVATKTITPTITQTATIITDNPKSSLGVPSWTDNLNDPKSWYQDDDEYTEIQPHNGTLKLTSLKSVGWHGWSMHYHKLNDFYLEANIKANNCNGNDQYGIVFRSPDYSQGYFFGVACNGNYFLSRYDGSNFHTIFEPKISGNLTLVPGNSNTLGVLANNNNISLYINDVFETKITDSTFTQGTFGVFIASYQTPGFNIELNDISYWTIE